MDFGTNGRNRLYPRQFGGDYRCRLDYVGYFKGKGGNILLSGGGGSMRCDGYIKQKELGFCFFTKFNKNKSKYDKI